MTGAELKSIRQGLGLTQSELGFVLGYPWTKRALEVRVCQWENDKVPIPKWVRRKAYELTERVG